MVESAKSNKSIADWLTLENSFHFIFLKMN